MSRKEFEAWYGYLRPEDEGVEQQSWDDSWSAWQAALEPREQEAPKQITQEDLDALPDWVKYLLALKRARK